MHAINLQKICSWDVLKDNNNYNEGGGSNAKNIHVFFFLFNIIIQLW